MNKNVTQKFTNARLLAVQAAYAKEFSQEPWDKIVSSFLLKEIGGRVIQDGIAGRETYIDIVPADIELFTKLLKELQEKEADINQIIRDNISKKIDFERLEILIKCILRIGIAEFYVNSHLDSPIIINEYVDMTRAFFDGPEAKVVNAILDKFSRMLKE